MMKLSIIIPTHRRPGPLLRLLDSLSRQCLARDQFEILVVSNFPDKRLRWLIQKTNEKQKNIRLLTANAKGANASRNLGIKESRGELLLLLDDDCIVCNRGYLEAVIDLHKEHPGALAIGGSYSVPDGCSLEDIAYNLISQEWQLSCRQDADESIRLIGGNVSYKRALLEESGQLFNPKISYGGAELEFHHRLSAGGATLLLIPTLTVHHVPEIRDGGRLIEKAYKQAMTAVQFAILEGKDTSLQRDYQPLRDIWALRHARDGRELEKICALMVGYDRAYNMVAEGRIFSLRKLRFRLLARRVSVILGRAG